MLWRPHLSVLLSSLTSCPRRLRRTMSICMPPKLVRLRSWPSTTAPRSPFSLSHRTTVLLLFSQLFSRMRPTESLVRSFLQEFVDARRRAIQNAPQVLIFAKGTSVGDSQRTQPQDLGWHWLCYFCTLSPPPSRAATRDLHKPHPDL